MIVKSGPCNSRMGSASGLGTPKITKEGPIPRRPAFLGAPPVMINPPIPTLSPLWTRIRVERLRACATGVELGVAVPVAVAVAVGVVVAVAVAVTVGAGVGVPVAVAVAVGVEDGQGVPSQKP